VCVCFTDPVFFPTWDFSRIFSLYLTKRQLYKDGRGAQRSFLRDDVPKQTVARRARTRSVAKTFKEHIFQIVKTK
jgi:hypothetical protein